MGWCWGLPLMCLRVYRRVEGYRYCDWGTPGSSPEKGKTILKFSKFQVSMVLCDWVFILGVLNHPKIHGFRCMDYFGAQEIYMIFPNTHCWGGMGDAWCHSSGWGRIPRSASFARPFEALACKLVCIIFCTSSTYTWFSPILIEEAWEMHGVTQGEVDTQQSPGLPQAITLLMFRENQNVMRACRAWLWWTWPNLSLFVTSPETKSQC
jgi:hypothetical protein